MDEDRRAPRPSQRRRPPRQSPPDRPGTPGGPPGPGAPGRDAGREDHEDAVELEITDVLDLHSFPPGEVPDLVRDYLNAAYDKGIRQLRIIHGRGKGVQRRTVRTLLERDPRVVDFRDAPGEGGGWGATVVTME